jgi:glyoxylase-like metal-dependent hydrolase (beta-lactamase superfamily II)
MQQRAPPLASFPPKVRVVRKGFLLREGDAIVDASSSVTLVEAAGKRIIVDTGSPRDVDRLQLALKSMMVRPPDVDIVVNTHLHIDHCGCNELFSNALVYAHKLEEPPIGSTRISGAVTLVPGVELVPTPGHTRGSISVFVTSDKKYAICGDAIPAKGNYETHVPPFIAFDKELASKSMDMILGWAEMVVPGHDEPFPVVRKR